VKAVAALLLLTLASLAGALSAAEPLKSSDCGRYTNMNWPATSTERSKNRCFVTAFRRGARATLITLRATVEGDPITMYYRVLGARRMEMIVDTREDRYGPRGWFRNICTGVSASANYRSFYPSGCRRAPLPRTLPPPWG
jgi:hypothetical protein